MQKFKLTDDQYRQILVVLESVANDQKQGHDLRDAAIEAWEAMTGEDYER